MSLTAPVVRGDSSIQVELPTPTPAFTSFLSEFDSLCVAAGPPAPSFATQDIDKCIATVLEHPSTYPAVFSVIDRRLSIDPPSATPISVRAMLFSLLARFVERTWNGQTRREEWCTLMAPHLYRIVMLVLPRYEDATANVGMTRGILHKWIQQADATAAAPFKRHQLVNAVKYVEGYTYEPPQPSETERAERKERKRARKRARREAEERSRKKQRREAAARSPDSTSRTSSPTSAAADSPAPRSVSPSRSRSSSPRSASRSRSRSRSRSKSPSPGARIRYLNRTSLTHTASEEAAASRFLEQIRASQKRTHTESSLRPVSESFQSWEEWEETRSYIRSHRQRQSEQRQLLHDSSSHAASIAASNPVAATPSSTSSSIPAAVDSIESFLATWLAPRNHWKATRDALGESEGQLSEGGPHELDKWYAYYQENHLPLPSQSIPNGAQRTWTKLNEPQAAAITRQQGLLLPRPPPTRLYTQIDNATVPSIASTASNTATAMVQ